MSIDGILNVVSRLVPAKMLPSLEKAVEIARSGRYSPDMAGALKIAGEYGFSPEAIGRMEVLARNPVLARLVNTVAPGASAHLREMLSQFVARYNGAAGPAGGDAVRSDAADDFVRRLERLSSVPRTTTDNHIKG